MKWTGRRFGPGCVVMMMIPDVVVVVSFMVVVPQQVFGSGHNHEQSNMVIIKGRWFRKGFLSGLSKKRVGETSTDEGRERERNQRKNRDEEKREMIR